MTCTIDIPDYHPPLLNALLSAHWSRRNRLKAECQQVVQGYALQAGIPRARAARKVSLRLEGWGRGGRTCDPDAAWKAILDALVACGLLVDDSPLWCVLGRVEVVRSARRRTVITLEEVEVPDAGDLS